MMPIKDNVASCCFQTIDLLQLMCLILHLLELLLPSESDVDLGFLDVDWEGAGNVVLFLVVITYLYEEVLSTLCWDAKN